MRILSSTYEPYGDIEPIPGLAVQLRTFIAEARVCALPNCAELLGNVCVQRVIGVRR
jgi:hypothetical protein